MRSDLVGGRARRHGVLITPEVAREDRDPQLAREGLLGLADMLQGVVVVDEVGKLVEYHAGDEPSGWLADLAEKIRHWRDRVNLAPRSAKGDRAGVDYYSQAGRKKGHLARSACTTVMSLNLPENSTYQLIVLSISSTQIS